MKKFLILGMVYAISVVSAMSTLHAGVPAEGGGSTGVGGGGDPTEAQIDEIRNDILNWINNGGSKGLNLPQDLSHDEYIQKMKSILKPRAVTLTVVTSHQEDETNDPELKVMINGKKKTCRGFISEKDLTPNIICNLERYQMTGEADQYSLVHHEYAGLVGVEKNDGAASDYEISNQLTSFLEQKITLKLGIKIKKQNIFKSNRSVPTQYFLEPGFFRCGDAVNFAKMDAFKQCFESGYSDCKVIHEGTYTKDYGGGSSCKAIILVKGSGQSLNPVYIENRSVQDDHIPSIPLFIICAQAKSASKEVAIRKCREDGNENCTVIMTLDANSTRSSPTCTAKTFVRGDKF